MNSAPAALAVLLAPHAGAGALAAAGAGVPSPLDEGAGETGVGFAGLLGPEAGTTSLDASDAVAATEVASTAPPADAPPPMPAPAAATPPPMTDPATAAVLNALALRVATESSTAAGTILPGSDASTPPATAAAQGAAPGPGLALLSLGAAIAQVTGRAGPGTTPADPKATAVAAAASVLPIKRANGDAAASELPLEALMADLAPAVSGGDAATPSTATTATLPGFLGATTAQPAALAGPAAPLAAIATVVAALMPPMAAADANELAMMSAVQGAGSVDASALAAASTGSSPPPPPPAASALQPAAFQAFLRADGSLPQIAVPMDSPQWGNELSTRVVAMAREQFTEAEIRVSPDELGPIEVKLRFDGDRVHAQFGAVSPEAREALSANLHRLRELLAGEGLNLGQTFVGHHGADRQPGQPGASAGSRSGGDATGDDLAVAAAAPRSAATRVGLLDEFA